MKIIKGTSKNIMEMIVTKNNDDNVAFIIMEDGIGQPSSNWELRLLGLLSPKDMKPSLLLLRYGFHRNVYLALKALGQGKIEVQLSIQSRGDDNGKLSTTFPKKALLQKQTSPRKNKFSIFFPSTLYYAFQISNIYFFLFL